MNLVRKMLFPSVIEPSLYLLSNSFVVKFENLIILSLRDVNMIEENYLSPELLGIVNGVKEKGLVNIYGKL